MTKKNPADAPAPATYDEWEAGEGLSPSSPEALCAEKAWDAAVAASMDPARLTGPAFPGWCNHDGTAIYEEGMTLRQYAAIKLKVPDSGTPWLDDMIRASLRDEFATSVLPEYLKDQVSEMASAGAYLCAGDMLKAREK